MVGNQAQHPSAELKQVGILNNRGKMLLNVLLFGNSLSRVALPGDIHPIEGRGRAAGLKAELLLERAERFPGGGVNPSKGVSRWFGRIHPQTGPQFFSGPSDACSHSNRRRTGWAKRGRSITEASSVRGRDDPTANECVLCQHPGVPVFPRRLIYPADRQFQRLAEGIHNGKPLDFDSPGADRAGMGRHYCVAWCERCRAAARSRG